MKIGCHCGVTLFDQTDGLANKGYLIPDQNWFATSDTLDDEVIAPLSRGTLSEDAACHLSRGILGRAVRQLWQCSTCGRLYIDGLDGTLHCFVPAEDGTDRRILRGRPEAPRDGRSTS